MHILAIETTNLSGSVALLDDAGLLQSRELPMQPRSAATLAPAIDDLFSAVGWKPCDVMLIAVATGPGSFTGLRVGVTTAKMLAYALKADVIGVNTMDAIAWQSPPLVDNVWTIVDAQRQQLFAAHFVRDLTGQFQTSIPTQIVDEARWLADLQPGCFVSGPALVKLQPRLPAGVITLDEALWQPRAAAVGQVAWRQYQSGHRDDLASLVPQYFRRSAAEEKLDDERRR
jgi:tRNA threonylcarbamoyladenosine biosynthesis protein TsaB